MFAGWSTRQKLALIYGNDVVVPGGIVDLFQLRHWVGRHVSQIVCCDHTGAPIARVPLHTRWYEIRQGKSPKQQSTSTAYRP